MRNARETDSADVVAGLQEQIAQGWGRRQSEPSWGTRTESDHQKEAIALGMVTYACVEGEV